jgi:DNA-binding MarR family transcriptional regulator
MSLHEINIIKEVFDLARYINANQAESKLTMIQLRTVMFIEKKDTVKPTAIARNFSITPASVTSQIDNLVKEGWLERIYNKDDKRVIEVTLTETGKRELPKEIKNLEVNNKKLFESLEINEQKTLLELLEKINQSVKA